MKFKTIEKFTEVAEKTGLSYRFTVATGDQLYNLKDTGIILLDNSEKAIVSIQEQSKVETALSKNGRLKLEIVNESDIHIMTAGGTYEQIMKFLENYGVSLNTEQKKTILNIDKDNYSLNPVAGNYIAFKTLTEEEIKKLNPEEYEQYLKNLENYNKRKNFLGKGAPLQVTI